MGSEDRAAIQEAVIESMERSAEVYGLSRSAGRIYGTLYFASEPLSIPDLVEETGYAKSTISNVTRTLTRLGLIRRRSSGGGGRRVKFDPQTDLWFVIQEVCTQYIQREFSATQRTLTRTLDRVDETEDEDLDGELERIRELQSTYDDLQTLLELAMDHSLDELIAAIEEYDPDES